MARYKLGNKWYDDDQYDSHLSNWDPKPEADGPLDVMDYTVEDTNLFTPARRVLHDAERQARIDRQGIPETKPRIVPIQKVSKVAKRSTPVNKGGKKQSTAVKGKDNPKSNPKEIVKPVDKKQSIRQNIAEIAKRGIERIRNDKNLTNSEKIRNINYISNRTIEYLSRLNSTPKSNKTAIPTDSIARDSVARDSVARDSVSRDTLSHSTDTIARDSVARDSVARDSLRVPRDTVPTDTISRDSLVQRPDSIQAAAPDSIRGAWHYYNGNPTLPGYTPNPNSNFNKTIKRFYRWLADQKLNTGKSVRRYKIDEDNHLVDHIVHYRDKTDKANSVNYSLPGDEYRVNNHLSPIFTRTIYSNNKPQLFTSKYPGYKPANRKNKRYYLDARQDARYAGEVIPGDTISTPNNDYILDSNYTPKRINKSKPKYSVRKPTTTSRRDSLRDSIQTDSLKGKKQPHYTPDEIMKLEKKYGENDSTFRRRVIEYGREQGFDSEDMKIWLKKHNLK